MLFRRSVILSFCHSTVRPSGSRDTRSCVYLLILITSLSRTSQRTRTCDLVNMATEHEDPAVTVFREYLKIKTVQPNPDYGKCSLD